MESRTIKQTALISVMAGLLTGCGSNLSDQIEGIKWAPVNSSGGAQVNRFVNGKFQLCKTKKGAWETKGTYEIDGDFIILRRGDKEQRKSISLVKKGSGKQDTLTIGTQSWLSIETKYCPFEKG